MLAELQITNFAIIDHLALHFDAGLLTFTGETGAGKSIIFDAVEVLLGGRADITVIRSGADIALIEGNFNIASSEHQAVHAILKSEDLLNEDDPNSLFLSRELRSNGRSTARINGRIATVSLLRQLGEYLVDLHGQSEHLSLLRTREHLGLLDRYANCEDLLDAYQENYQQLQTTRRRLYELRQAEQDATRRADLLRYQIDEIQAAHLKPDEEDNLRVERDRLANAEELASLANEALQALDEGPQGVSATTDLLGQAIHALSKIQRLDSSQAVLHEQAQLLFENLNDLGHKLRTYLENIEFDPQRLQQLEERLDLIHRLKRKYGEIIPQILAFAEKARQDLDTITHTGEQIAELEARSHELLSGLAQQGQALSLARHSASLKLADAVQSELNDLHMTGAQFRVDFQQQLDPEGVLLEDGRLVAFDATGFEQVEFLIAPNPGEGLKPLVKIASGGETSRLMLALKNVLAHADYIPTLIFDEIDQGIGGRVGAVVGQKLWQLARNHQVLCITHLPQLASYGDQHYQVQKTVQGGRTATQVTILEGEDRIRELALMFGELSEGTLRSAFELLEAANSKTSQAYNHN